jgi:hypothetical protein
MSENKFTQLCVWPGTVLGDNTIQDLENFFLQEMKTRIKYHAEVKTLPDVDSDNNPIPETGGRNDLFFFVHSDDVQHFALPRLQMGIRWWEDVVGYNNNRHLYTEEFLKNNPTTW